MSTLHHGLTVIGTGYSGRNVACDHPTLQAAKCGLQTDTSTAISSAGAKWAWGEQGEVSLFVWGIDFSPLIEASSPRVSHCCAVFCHCHQFSCNGHQTLRPKCYFCSFSPPGWCMMRPAAQLLPCYHVSWGLGRCQTTSETHPLSSYPASPAHYSIFTFRYRNAWVSQNVCMLSGESFVEL